jgi:ferredoxin
MEEPALNGLNSTHYRQWDSCFTEGHSAIHGIVIRADTRQRYRQWLTHKLGSWHDQYGRSGCVGCGRCIAWCPAGIDITAEAAAVCGGNHV